MALVILVGILDHRKYHNEGQGWQHGRLTVRDRDFVDHLHAHDDEEVHVGHLFGELLEEIVR